MPVEWPYSKTYPKFLPAGLPIVFVRHRLKGQQVFLAAAFARRIEGQLNGDAIIV